MARPSNKPLSEQSRRFIEEARKAGASEDERVFDENLKRIVKPSSNRDRRDELPQGILLPDAGDYPRGKPGDYAVCWSLESGGAYEFYRTDNKVDADATLRRALARKDLFTVILTKGPHAGRRSAMAYIIKCDKTRHWKFVGGTEAANEKADEWGLEEFED